jgi:Swt1-like HEPN
VAEQLNVTDALRATENVLRDFIALTLSRKFGQQWEDQLGVTAERIQKWRERREEEAARLSTGNLETRLLYFADFPDLKTIIAKNWELFKDVFGEKRQFDVLLSMLEDFRNPDAHRRGLLPFQEQLVAGICGEIRTQIARYRSRLETSEDCFPRIESAFDNYGRAFPEGDLDSYQRPTLRVGDLIQISINASDPEGRPLMYRFGWIPDSLDALWQTSNTVSMELQTQHIAKGFMVQACIQSDREYHAGGDYDDAINFYFDVLPKR